LKDSEPEDFSLKRSDRLTCRGMLTLIDHGMSIPIKEDDIPRVMPHPRESPFRKNMSHVENFDEGTRLTIKVVSEPHPLKVLKILTASIPFSAVFNHVIIGGISSMFHTKYILGN